MTASKDSRGKFQTARRVLELQRMLESGLALSIAAISSRLGVEKAAARSYLGFVREQWNLRSFKEGREKLWVLPSKRWDKDDLDKAAALDFAVNALADLEGTRYHKLLEEFARAARNRLQGDTAVLERVSSSFIAVRPERSNNRNYGSYIEVLLDAVRERRAVGFRYRKLNGDSGRYEVEPWAVTFHRGRAALVGGKRNEPGFRWPPRRTFAIDRISDLSSVPGPRFDPPTEKRFSPTMFLNDSFGIYTYGQQRPIELVLHIRGEAAVLLRDRRVHHSQLARDLDGEILEVRLNVCECPELRSWLLSMVPDVTVVAPSGLAQWLHETCRRYVEAPPF